MGQLAKVGGGSREDEATQPATHSQIGAMWGAGAFQAATQPRGQCRLSSQCLPGTQGVNALLAGLNDSQLSTASRGQCRLSSHCLPGTQEVNAFLAGLNDSQLSTASRGPCDLSSPGLPDTQEINELLAGSTQPASLLDTAAPGRIPKKHAGGSARSPRRRSPIRAAIGWPSRARAPV